MAYKITENRLGQTLIGAVDTSAAVPVGTIVRATDPTYGGGEFIYLKGVASTVLGSWVTYSLDDGATVLLVASTSPDDPVAVAMGATIGSTWGWYQINGRAVGKAKASYADNAEVYATSTGGSIDDTVVAGDRVVHATGASAVGTPSSGLAEFEIRRPYVDQANVH